MNVHTTHSEREQLAGGVIRHTQHIKPIAYRDGGTLKRISHEWQDSGNPNRPHIVTAAPFLISAGNNGMRRIHPTREMDRYFEIGAPYIKSGGTWSQVNLGSPNRNGNLLTWTTANANLYVQMGGHFIKLAILLKNDWQPPAGEFAFPVGLNGLTRDGGKLLADGEVVMHARKPHVEDFDNPSDVRPIALDFVHVGGQWYAHFTLPDLTGMSRPLIDPTFEAQPDATAGVDVDVRENDPTTNKDGAPLNFGIEESFRYRALLKFDLSDVPDTASISSATLSLYLNLDRASTSSVLRVFRQKRAWVESEATWNEYSTGNSWQTAGGFGANDCEQTDIGNAAYTNSETLNQFFDISLTPTTKDGLDLGNGWLIKSDENADDRYRFASSDDATAANRPKLTVEYTVPSGVGSAAFASMNLLHEFFGLGL